MLRCARKGHLLLRIAEGVYNCNVPPREIQALGYQGGLPQLQPFVGPHRRQFRLQAVRRFETRSGVQAQVDWAYLGQFVLDGRTRKVWAFVLVLGYSHYIFAECVTDTTLPTLLWLHERHSEPWAGYSRRSPRTTCAR